MPIINNVPIWFAKLDPKRPNSKFNKANPTWECQIRTEDKEVKKQWEAMNLPVKAILPDEGNPYWRVNLRKKSFKVDKEPASPVKVVNGALEDIDPNTIGNGSIGNIRIFQYDYQKADGTPGVVSVLMGVQITKHLVYKAKPRGDEFGMSETETIDPPDNDDDEGFTTKVTSPSPSVPSEKF
jgi:hypothetical protein